MYGDGGRHTLRRALHGSPRCAPTKAPNMEKSIRIITEKTFKAVRKMARNFLANEEIRMTELTGVDITLMDAFPLASIVVT